MDYLRPQRKILSQEIQEPTSYIRFLIWKRVAILCTRLWLRPEKNKLLNVRWELNLYILQKLGINCVLSNKYLPIHPLPNIKKNEKKTLKMLRLFSFGHDSTLIWFHQFQLRRAPGLPHPSCPPHRPSAAWRGTKMWVSFAGLRWGITNH